MRVSAGFAVCAAVLMTILAAPIATAQVVKEYTVPRGDHPHDVAPAPDGSVWYTAQAGGALGRLDPITGRVSRVSLGAGSRPHGVIVGPDGAAWVTDSGLNAILRVDPLTSAIRRYPLPAGAAYADLNTAAFDSKGTLWFTGQAGYYGSVNPDSGRTRVFEAPRGRGPYGITGSPDGYVYFVSLAGSYVGRIDPRTGEVTVLEPPWPGQGTRRIWADSRGILWITGWSSGALLRLDPRTKDWKQYALPERAPCPMHSMSMRVTGYGSAILPPTPSSFMNPEQTHLPPFPSPARGLRYGRCWGGRENSGARNQGPTSLWLSVIEFLEIVK